MSEPIKSIVIVGGGTAGWMAAASLVKFAENKELSITLIESTAIGTVGVGEATIPNIVEFNKNLGIDEIDFIKATKASFKLGIQFEHWHRVGKSFFHPFADYGLKIDGIDFHQYINRVKASKTPINIEDYCFASVLAKHENFAQPHPNPPSPLADYSYAYHFDAGLYANFLKDFSIKLGCKHICSTVSSVNLEPNTGFIDSLTLDNGNNVKADFFIDCSGFQGLLIEQALNTGYEDWNHWLFCDSALAVQTQNNQNTKTSPYTRSIAEKAGWQWRIPLQHRMGNGYIFSSQYESEQTASDTLLSTISGKQLNDVRKINFNPGRRNKIWNKNCLAVGLASGFLEPLESTSISLIQSAIAKLLTFFPDKSFNQHDINEVNRLHNTEVEQIRDFLILHYKLTKRSDSTFWQACQTMDIPSSLEHKIELYKSRGHVVMLDNESFEQASWLTMYNGFNLSSQRYDTRVDAIDINLITEKLEQMKSSIKQAAQQAPSHDEFINKHCRA